METIRLAIFCYVISISNFSHAADLTLRNARIVTGNGQATYTSSIVIKNGRIVEISNNAASWSGDIIDVKGLTVLPGLMDAHVHLQAVPGSAYRNDSDEIKKQLRKHHLRAYVASGVTTVLDAGISVNVLKTLIEYINAGGTAPNVLALAPVLYTKGGYLDSDIFVSSSKPVANRLDILDLFEEYEGIPNIIGMKVPLEYGFGPVPIWPIHSSDMRRTISEISLEKNRPIYVHATQEKEQLLGIAMGAKALVHSGFWDESPSKIFLSQMKKHNTYLVSTLSGTLDLHLDEWHPERLVDPLIKLTVPPLELETLDDPAAWKWSTQKLARGMQPDWVPDFISNFLAEIFLQESQIVKMLTSATAAVKIMYDAGIPIVVGTDSGNYPLVLNFFHGPSTIREMELLSLAGIPNMDVISSATSIPAKMLGIDHKVGTVEVGKNADLLVMICDPVKAISCLRKIKWVIKDGVMKTPTQWMTPTNINY